MASEEVGVRGREGEKHRDRRVMAEGGAEQGEGGGGGYDVSN